MFNDIVHKCRHCGRLFKIHQGFYSYPPEHDPSVCGSCNKEASGDGDSRIPRWMQPRWMRESQDA